MSEKKNRALRKLKQVDYDPGEDPIKKRKYAMVVCKKRIGEGRHITFARSGYMLMNKGKRLLYRAAKKAYRNGWIKV
jgi:hypothetical protein